MVRREGMLDRAMRRNNIHVGFDDGLYSELERAEPELELE